MPDASNIRSFAAAVAGSGGDERNVVGGSSRQHGPQRGAGVTAFQLDETVRNRLDDDLPAVHTPLRPSARYANVFNTDFTAFATSVLPCLTAAVSAAITALRNCASSVLSSLLALSRSTLT